MSHEHSWRFDDTFLRALAAPGLPALQTPLAVRRIGRRRFLQLSGITGALLVLGAALGQWHEHVSRPCPAVLMQCVVGQPCFEFG